MFFIWVTCFLLLVYYLYTRNYNYWELRGVPYEKPFLIFGNFYNVVARKQHIYQRIREIYSNFNTPYVGIYIFNQPALLIRSPDLVKKILVKDFDKFSNRKFASNESVDPLVTHSLFSAQTNVWKYLRAKISPVFTSSKTKAMLPLLKECTSDLVDYLKKHSGMEIDVTNMTKRYAVDIISSCAFGIHAHCFKNENSEILKAATQLVNVKSFVRVISIFSYNFAPKLVDIFRLKLLDEASTKYLINIFNKTITERENKSIQRHDLIDSLNNLRRTETLNDNYKFDDIKMSAQALTFFSGGSDSTSQIIWYTLYELALNKKIQNRLRQEIRETFEQYGDFTYEAIQDMKYLDMVLCETLRKYPVASYLNRKCTAKYTFVETELTLDKNISVLIPLAALHMDPQFFPNPEKYIPERFTEGNKHTIPYIYLPFGDGPRNCIGRRFGVIGSKLALAYCLKDFAFETTEATTIPLQLDPGSLSILNKTGLYLKIIEV